MNLRQGYANLLLQMCYKYFPITPRRIALGAGNRGEPVSTYF